MMNRGEHQQRVTGIRTDHLGRKPASPRPVDDGSARGPRSRSERLNDVSARAEQGYRAVGRPNPNQRKASNRPVRIPGAGMPARQSTALRTAGLVLLVVAVVFIVGFFNTPREGSKALLRGSERSEMVKGVKEGKAFLDEAVDLIGMVSVTTPPEQYPAVAEELRDLAQRTAEWKPHTGLDPFAAVMRELAVAEQRLVEGLVGQWELGAPLEVQQQAVTVITQLKGEAQRRLELFVTRNGMEAVVQ